MRIFYDLEFVRPADRRQEARMRSSDRTIVRIIVVATVLIIAALFLFGCGFDEVQKKDPYSAGKTYDAEDYNGPQQQVARHEHEPAVMGTRPKTKTESYCTSRKNGVCKTWGTRTVTTGTETYTSDDEDWYVVLADGTRVDMDAAEQARYPVGSMYP